MSLSPGEIYLAFDAAGGRRPFVVVSRSELNRGEYFLAVPFTTRNVAVRRSLPNCVHFDRGAFGLPKECVAQAEALTILRTIDLVQPVARLGVLSRDAMARLISAIGHVIQADCTPRS